MKEMSEINSLIHRLNSINVNENRNDIKKIDNLIIIFCLLFNLDFIPNIRMHKFDNNDEKAKKIGMYSIKAKSIKSGNSVFS